MEICREYFIDKKMTCVIFLNLKFIINRWNMEVFCVHFLSQEFFFFSNKSVKLFIFHYQLNSLVNWELNLKDIEFKSSFSRIFMYFNENIQWFIRSNKIIIIWCIELWIICATRYIVNDRLQVVSLISLCADWVSLVSNFESRYICIAI